jgi:hypothetical protein
MEMRPASDQTTFVRSTLQAGGTEGRKGSAQEAIALWEDRERRRIEFRSSLVRARGAQARMEGREIAKHALRQLSAGLMERNPARMMADPASAR